MSPGLLRKNSFNYDLENLTIACVISFQQGAQELTGRRSGKILKLAKSHILL